MVSVAYCRSSRRSSRGGVQVVELFEFGMRHFFVSTVSVHQFIRCYYVKKKFAVSLSLYESFLSLTFLKYFSLKKEPDLLEYFLFK